MKTDHFELVSAHELRIGMFVDLDGGWLAHPFATNQFRISNERQLEVLRSLGLERIRYLPAKSDHLNGGTPAAPAAGSAVSASTAVGNTPVAATSSIAQPRKSPEQQRRAELHAAQQSSLAECERRFTDSAQQYRKTLDLLQSKPAEAGQLSRSLVQGLASEIQQQSEAAIRLLTEAAGDKVGMHPVNVTVIALLLGRALQMQGPELLDLGLAAFLHDVGKLDLNERLRQPDEHFSVHEQRAYQSHVESSVRMASEMQLSPGAIRAIAQHHELVDGTGFPEHLKLDALSLSSRILALVNRYDNLCNPFKSASAMTPHEALALIFSQQKTRFDSTVLSAFIRMIGVYPPGSVVQLNDERHALVVSVNSALPLKPRVLVHEPNVPRHEALILDLEHVPNASIRRSLKPANLPPAAAEYLRPSQRICYFFESGTGAGQRLAA